AKRACRPELALRKPSLAVSLTVSVEIEFSGLDVSGLDEGIRTIVKMGRITRTVTRPTARHRAKFLKVHLAPLHPIRSSKFVSIFAANATASAFSSFNSV